MKQVKIIEIDDDIPMPTSRRRAVYPWKELEVGQSFFVPATDDMPMSKRQNSIFSSVAYYRISNGLDSEDYAVSTRRWPKKRPNGIRVWRVR